MNIVYTAVIIAGIWILYKVFPFFVMFGLFAVLAGVFGG